MPKSYVYRMDHDTGFAPNTKYGICSLAGCKTSTVEKWADKGSWIIGIGGNNTGRPDTLIYVMEVEHCFSLSEFRARYPQKSEYLKNSPVEKVLVSRRFYYFGDKAIDLPIELEHLIIDRQGCKRVTEEDVCKLRDFLAENGYTYGMHGSPNNPFPHRLRSKCLCRHRIEHSC